MPIVSLVKKDASKNSEFEVEEGEVLFDALDNQGEKLPHGCLAGSCGACRIEVLEGGENLKAPSLVEQNTLADIKENYEKKHGKGSTEGREIRLACRAKVFGNVKFKPFR
ncbi:MAG: 2Fe-2S iron-sulfur cluster-binding protein [Bacteriovoracaceae bacterium]